MAYPAHRIKLFQKAIIYSSSKIVNTLKKKYNLKITTEKNLLIPTLLLQYPLDNLEKCFNFKFR